MELISFRITNSLQFAASLSQRQMCHPVSSQTHSRKQETKDSPSRNSLIKTFPTPSIANEYQRRDSSSALREAQILSLLTYDSLLHSVKSGSFNSFLKMKDICLHYLSIE